MRLLKTITAGAAFALAAPAPALAQSPPAAAPAAAADYSNPANWLCLPGRADACGRPLPTTVLNANGYGSVGQAVPAADPPADCFYLYPTISRDPGANSDLVPGIEEQAVAAVQLARFGSVCKTYAPMYRQVTLAALQSVMAGKPMGDFSLAYGDVLNAWHYYLEHQNKGRPFILIGHSQGTVLLSKLLARDIEGSDAARRMLSAILLGFNIEVPEGKRVGGTFKQTPLCSSVGETGCVLTYVSFRADSPPPDISFFGRAAAPGMTVGCTNPARLRSERTALDSYWYAGPSSVPSSAPPIVWSSGGTPPTPFLRTDGLVSAQCVNRGPIGYLAVTVNADPRDPRTDRIPGDVELGGKIAPGWGLHLADMSMAMGDLMALIEAQEAAFAKR
jgi:hypothetical protein